MANEQEFVSAWDSFRKVMSEIVPLLVVSATFSIVQFLRKHYGVEPFSAARFIIGMFTDIIYGTMVGLVALACGAHRYIAWGLAAFVVHCGMRQLERICLKLICKKLEIEEVSLEDAGTDGRNDQD